MIWLFKPVGKRMSGDGRSKQAHRIMLMDCVVLLLREWIVQFCILGSNI